MTVKPLLTLKNVTVQINTPSGVIQPVDDVCLSIAPGEIFALVGESGCGKSMTALSINRLLPDNAQICEGSEIYLNDVPLHELSEESMRKIREKRFGMIFQDPATALNPVLTIGEQIFEALIHGNGHEKSKKQIWQQVIELLKQVRLPHADWMLKQYLHQLS